MPTLDPRAGGPREVVLQRGTKLSELGHTVEVLTLDAPGSGFLQELPLRVHALGPSSLGYRLNGRLVAWLRASAQDYDAVIVDGLWQFNAFGTWRALRRGPTGYFVFPHGMLDSWFKRQYPLKHLKKWLYWPWADYRVLRDARAVLYTSEEERRSSRASFWLYRAREELVSLGTGSPPAPDPAGLREFHDRHSELRARRCLLFLGRIHEKKGCDLLIEALARTRALEPRLHLIMAGPAAEGYARKLESRARELGVADRITWTGMLQGAAKWAAFRASEAFILPSHQENFGVAVAEALGCALPVLVSDKVNIWREIETDGAGLVAPDTVDGTEYNLRRWLALDEAERAEMGSRAARTFSSRFTLDVMASSFLDALRRHGVGAPAVAAPGRRELTHQ